MLEAKVVELLPNGLTKVDLRNDERKHYLFEKGVIDELLDRMGCDCERCQKRRESESL